MPLRPGPDGRWSLALPHVHLEDPVAVPMNTMPLALVADWTAGLTEPTIVVADPDDNRLRLYTLETHGPELSPSRDPWLGA